jgi:Arc/MetJ-type ribon-helix-helix transcriptional regulator
MIEATNVSRVPETEKITINLGHVDLGRVDLLVRDGFFSNRTDFIRTAIRNQLDRHEEPIKTSVARTGLELGLRRYGRAELEAAAASRSPLHIRVLGLAILGPDVTPDLARAGIASIQVLGTLQAPADVKRALDDRTI